MMSTIETDITLSAEQKALFKVMEETSQHMFVTGRAGAGKSVLLRHFRENTRKKVVVAAPTGIAALNVKGQTIHSLFKLAPELYRPGSLEPNSRLYSLLKRIDTLVIDEISMVRADLLDAIDERFRKACDNDLPFGGKQIIMFGDCYQLPPVVDRDLMDYFDHVYGGYFFFNALAWKQTEFKIFELTQVFRQKDPVFKDILNAVRDGSIVDSQLEDLNARYGVAIPDDGKTITLAPTNSLVTNINQKRLNQLEGKAYEYKAMITGKMGRSTFPTEEIIQLKVGAQVVLLQNDKDKRWVNGTVATISSLEKHSKEPKTEEKITVCVDGIDHVLEKATWEEIKYEYDREAGKVKAEVVSSFTQYPIRLAWALTIHKSQGQTYQSIALDLTTSTFAPGQMYVALSRATSMEGLYLKMPVKRKDIIVDAKVIDFMAKREAIVVAVVEGTIEEITTPDNPILAIEAPEVATEEIVDKGLRKDGTPRVRAEGGGRKSKAEKDKRVKKNIVFDRDIYACLEAMAEEKGKPLARILEGALLGTIDFSSYYAEWKAKQNNTPDDDNPGGGAPVPSANGYNTNHPGLTHVYPRDEYSMDVSQFNHSFSDGISPEELEKVSSGVLDIANSIPDSEIIASEPQETAFNLFPEMDNVENITPSEKVVRRFYTCKHYTDYPKKCNHSWAVDYYVDKWGRAYRIDENGAQIWAKRDATACPSCGQANGYIRSNDLQAKLSESHKCDSRCYNATGNDCKCACGGSNHGTGHLQGTRLVVSVEQIELVDENM